MGPASGEQEIREGREIGPGSRYLCSLFCPHWAVFLQELPESVQATALLGSPLICEDFLCFPPRPCSIRPGVVTAPLGCYLLAALWPLVVPLTFPTPVSATLPLSHLQSLL